MKLYTYPGNPRAIKILIAAKYNSISLEIPPFDVKKDSKSKEFLAKNPLGKVPLLETSQGCIFESNAIARYVARIRNDTGLYGKTFFESAQVDAWIDFSAHELEVPIEMWLHPILGHMAYHAAVTAKAKEDVKKALQIIEDHLNANTFMVGDQITLADIVLFSALVYPMKMIFDGEFRQSYPSLSRWFSTLLDQSEIKAVVGKVLLCDVAIVAATNQSTDDTLRKESPKKQAQEKKGTSNKRTPKKEPQQLNKEEKKQSPLKETMPEKV